MLTKDIISGFNILSLAGFAVTALLPCAPQREAAYVSVPALEP